MLLPVCRLHAQDADSLAYLNSPLMFIPGTETTGAVSSVDGRTLQKFPVAGLQHTLPGLLSGLTTMTSQWEPGNATGTSGLTSIGMTMLVRGLSSIHGYNNVLIVIDGMICPSSNWVYIMPNEVESITVLKDAASASIYGIQGANGVICITTKRECEYYGDKIAVNQISSISSPEPRQLLIKPYDKGDVKSIVAAINAANLGVNPINEGDAIRITVAPLTEETRKLMVKKAKAMSEDIKVAIRNVRREYVDFVRDADDMTDDYKDRVQDDLQKVVDEVMKQVETVLAEKEKEIMTV